MKKWFLSLAAIFFVLYSCKNSSNDADNDQPVAEEISSPSGLKYNLEWTGFKTAAKTPVKGTFTSISYNNVNNNGKTLEEKVDGAGFTIDAATVESGDEGRNHNIASGLFEKMADTEISGSFSGFSDGKTNVKLTMNDVSRTIPFEYTMNGDTLVISGTIDIIKDFSANKAMQNFAELCGELHDGKSWTEVDIVTKIYQ